MQEKGQGVSGGQAVEGERGIRLARMRLVAGADLVDAGGVGEEARLGRGGDGADQLVLA